MNTILSVKNISKSFPGVKALDGVSLDVRSGEIHALLGENGAGKSTFIKIVSGVIQADKGQIFIDEKPVQINAPFDAQRHGISVVHQELNNVPWLDVATNFMLGREKAGRIPGSVDQKYSRKLAKEYLKILGCDIDVSKKMVQLPFAQQQLVEIAKALSTNPKVIILDEPTSSLAQKERDLLYNAVRTLRNNGVGIIYITHIFEEVFELSDRVTVLRDGQYIGTRDTADINESSLIKMVVGREVVSKPRESVAKDEVVLEVKNMNSGKKLQDINLELHRGEILGIAGLAGAGRSELLRALFGADSRDSGEIILEGKSLAINSPYDAYRCGIALVPEERKAEGLLMEMDMQYNNACAALDKTLSKFKAISYKKVKEMAIDTVEKFDVSPPDINRKAKFFSGGNQQKIVVGKCLNAEPKILLVDEPTRGVDVGAKEEIHSILDRMARDGKGVIVVSSDMLEVLKLADRVLVMREGRIVKELSRQEATQETIISYAMGGSINE